MKDDYVSPSMGIRVPRKLGTARLIRARHKRMEKPKPVVPKMPTPEERKQLKFFERGVYLIVAIICMVIYIINS